MNFLTFVLIFVIAFGFIIMASMAGTTFGTMNQCAMQVGSKIKSDTTADLFGSSVDMSSDGNRLVVGALYDFGNGVRNGGIYCPETEGAGYVRVYDYEEGEWVQIGDDTNGEEDGDWFGRSVAISSDGSRIVVGGSQNDGNGAGAGHVRVYQYQEGEWLQLGEDIDGEAENDHFGRAVAISSDGNRVVVGAPENDGNGDNSGHARVYHYEDGEWAQLGDDMGGEAEGDRFGQSVSMSGDGDRIAIGAPCSNGNGENYMRIYQYHQDGIWVQLGSDIHGEAHFYCFSYHFSSIAISLDGNHIIVGDENDDKNHARVYHYRDDNNDWVQVGDDIHGIGKKGRFGRSVAISNDGNYAVVGAPSHEGISSGGSVFTGYGYGYVRVFAYEEDGGWKKLATIHGEESNNNFGYSVAISGEGDRIFVGSYAQCARFGSTRVFSIADC